MTDEKALEHLRSLLESAGCQVKPSYNPSEVGLILGISYHTFRRMCREYEIIDGRPKPGTLDSFKIRGERRVTLHELARYLHENNCYRKGMED